MMSLLLLRMGLYLHVMHIGPTDPCKDISELMLCNQTHHSPSQGHRYGIEGAGRVVGWANLWKRS